MNKKAVIAVTAVAILCSVAFVSADIQAKPTKGVIMGTAIEISTYAMKGSDEDSVDAMVKRAKEGFPVGIIEEETGTLWVCVYRSSAPASALETANDEMLPLMGKKIVAQGLKYQADGVNVLRMSVISEY